MARRGTPDDRWSEPDTELPVEDAEEEERPGQRQPGKPAREPFSTLLGDGGPMPEAEYGAGRRDPSGAAGLWRALEAFSPPD